MKTLKNSDKKYFDDIFPPGESSLFYNRKKVQKKYETYKNMRWLRVS